MSSRADEVPRFTAIPIALVPVFPPLYLLAFLSLRFVQNWSKPAKFLFAFYLTTQILAALFSPHPALSIVLALARGLFVLALLTTGAWLGSTRRLYPVLFGLAIVYLTALASSFLTYGTAIFNLRLKHPYYTEVSLGLSAAIGLLLVATWEKGNRWVRLGFALLAVTVLALSGSRGALLSLVVGGLVGTALGYRRMALPVLSGAALIAAAFALNRQGRVAQAIERLLSLDPNGRNRFWSDAWQTFLSHPWGGVGPYQLGPYLKSLYWGQCQLWPILEKQGLHCPGWLKPLSGAWIIAHNALLHQLGETGVIGTLGLVALLGWIAYAVWKARDPLITAVFVAFMTVSFVDVPIAVPSLHLAEFFWVTMGIALAKTGHYLPTSVGSTAGQHHINGAS